MSDIKDRINKTLLKLGIVAATILPTSNANARNEIPKDDIQTDKIESAEFSQARWKIHENEGDSIFVDMNTQYFRLAEKNSLRDHLQQEINRDDVLDNGYIMTGNSYTYQKNGKMKDCDHNLVLHTPDGREVDCSFLNKFDFISAGTVTDETTGQTQIRTPEYVINKNALTEKKAKIETMKRIKNPNDRKAIEQYVSRIRHELDNFIGSAHTTKISSRFSEERQSITASAEKVNKATKEFQATAKKQMMSFEGR